MAHDHRTDDQESLFPDNGPDEQTSPADDGDSPEGKRPDFSSEEERLRNGDISFRPVSLPGPDPEPAVRKSGTGGTALMIVAAIIVVVLLTYVINTFYSPSRSGQEEAAVTEPAGQPDAEGEGSPAVTTPQPPADEPAAIFQAHAELQENYRLSEKRIAELEAENETLRSSSQSASPAAGSGVDQDRLARLEEENRNLKAGLAEQRRDSESAVTRAEQLVERAEAQVNEERGRTRTARQEAQALAREKEALSAELGALNTQVAELETEVSRRREEYDRLTANTTTRLEGESEAVRQLISRHAEELERERAETREKEAEIRRLNGLIARLSVAETGSGSQSRTAPPSGSSTAGSGTEAVGGVDAPPRILTRSAPEYPVNARRLRVEGTVLLNVLVGTDGQVRQVKVIEAEGGKLLSPAAVDAVKKWTFSPATRGGRPVECWHKVPIKFAL